jgi:hypothetical protein
MKSLVRSLAVFLLLLSAAAFSAAGQQTGKLPVSRAEQLKYDIWRKAMVRVPMPKHGCFKAVYPSMEWQEAQCAKPPDVPYPPPPQVVGGGGNTDFAAQPAHPITSSTGSFDTVNVANENDGGTADKYSLQLNTRPFNTPVCAGSGAADCQGWQQFLYSTSFQRVWIQYWLLDYPNPCPAGWMRSGTVWCMQNSAISAVVVGAEPISVLQQLSLTGTASAGNDTVVIAKPGVPPTVTGMAGDGILSLSGNWSASEFNVFGDGNGGQATFNAGATMAVRTAVSDGTMDPPACVQQSYTGETNNFDMVPPCCPYGGPSPAIVFWLSTNAGATSMCTGGTSIGDTHLTNFNGLLYDFQSAGDFVLATTQPSFAVYTRQRSGAPTWPNAAVNKAVAMILGPTRAAVCLDPVRVIIDDKQRDLADGKSMTLPTGVYVARSGNTYLFARPTGESVSAEVNDGWINVSIGLDHRLQARVWGLVGNVNGPMTEDELATRERKVLSSPVSFDDLYRPYDRSWRIPIRESLVTRLCGGNDVEERIPDRPFYAQQLDRETHERARAICEQARVRDSSLLDACILDTAVLGKGAAVVYTRMPPPRAELRVGEERK